jgi:WD40 repeat protein
MLAAVRAEDLPDQRPTLRIEPRMHTAVINRIGVNAACTLMVTGSDDKTARLWALPEGGRGSPELKRTLYVPIGEGDDGKVFAVAMSPDGKWIAVGGSESGVQRPFRKGAVYVFDATTGHLAARFGRFGAAIFHLAFSPDGSRLAATLGSGGGMRLWQTADWRLLAKDADYGGKDSYGAAFDEANRLFTVAYDSQIRRYGADGHLEATAAAQGGKAPFSIAVQSQGGKLAIGFTDSTAVPVYDAHTLKRLYAAESSGGAGDDLESIAWSGDGTRLYAGGRYQNEGSFPLVIWQEAGRGRRSEKPLSQSTIMQLLPCGDGVAAGAQDPAFGILAPDGTKRVWQEGVSADMREKLGQNFTLSADGKRVRFGLKEGGEQPVLFDLTTFRLIDSPVAVAGLSSPRTTGLGVNKWENSYVVKLNGKPIPLKDRETSRALAIAPDASSFVLGTEWFLRAYRADGTELWPQENQEKAKPAPGIAWGVNISANGTLAVVAYGDGTIRWYRLSSGQELLALFVHAKDRRFIAWTPKGYYAASPGAEDLIGWHVNRDWNHAPDFFPASRFRDQFNRPDIVKRVLDDLDEDKAIAEANRLTGAKPAPDIHKTLPPVITILSPQDGGNISGNSLSLRYSVRSPSGLPVSEVIALIDGRPLPDGADKGLVPVSVSDATERIMTLRGLPPRDFALSLIARSGDIDSVPFVIQLKYQGPPASGGPKGSLYIFAVGADTFEDNHVRSLNWAGKDARDFAAALKAQEGRQYGKVEVNLLTGKEAVNGKIIDGLVWLKRQVKPGDVGVVFLSGHGVTDPTGDYYFVPYNAKIEMVNGKPQPERSSSIPDTEFSHALQNLSGNALFFFDTCHAGSAVSGVLDYNKLINKISDTASAVVFASSTGAEESQERDEWQQGAFTKALLEGLAGAADYDKDGVITINELILYVGKRVIELTRDMQHTVEIKPRQTRNFSVAKVP